MGGARLQAFAVVHHRLHAVGGHRARKLFLFRLFARNHGDRQAVFGKFFIDLQHALRLFLRLFGARMGGMPLLPEKFAGAKKRPRRLFPAHNVAPLIDFKRQIAVGLYPFGIHRPENRLGSGTDRQRLGKLFSARDGHHGDLGGKPFDVFRLLGEKAHGDQQGKIGVFHALRLKPPVELPLNIFPDRIPVGTDDHRALDGAVIDQLGL